MMADARYRLAHRTTSPLVLREARVAPRVAPGVEVVATILRDRYGDAAGASGAANGLLGFQRDAAARARDILARRGGVLIADSVGLGKTHVALDLLRHAFDAGARVAIVGPAALERHWRSHVRGRGAFEWYSYARLGRGGAPLAARDFVVFDEAHALRNPTTRRYRAAQELARGANVVLLSATPVNNSLWDLYHLIRLFAADRDFLDVGVASLRSAFEEGVAECLLGSAPSIQPVLRAVSIRRTRAVLQDSPHDDARRDGSAGTLGFPRQDAPVPVYYAFSGRDEPDLLGLVGAALPELTFPAHGFAAGAPVELLRGSLFKRLESSAHALACSLGRYDALLRACERGLQLGVLVVARDRPDFDAEQLGFDELLYRPLPAGTDVRALLAALERERALVDRMRRALAGCADAKVHALEQLLGDRLRGRRVIVFTQFRDTARHLHARLVRRFRTALVDGAGAMLGNALADRATVVRRFAPIANDARPPGPIESIDVLVATDVLSEGFNLQDASVVVSYDLPWNPVRLIQRIGRVDRLGSPHATVASFHFLPGDLDRYLGLVERIARKTGAIEASVGSDMPALHAGLVRALDRRDARGIAQFGVERDVFALDERLRALLRELPAAPRAGGFVYAVVTGAARDCAVVAARVGARVEWVAVRDGVGSCDDGLCAALLEDAARQRAPGPVSDRVRLEQVLDAARRFLARRAAVTEAAPLLPAGGTAGRLGRRLLELAAVVPGGADSALCGRIEAALERLAAAPERLLPAWPAHASPGTGTGTGAGAGAGAGAGTGASADLRGLLDRLDALPPARPVAAREERRVELVGAVIAVADR